MQGLTAGLTADGWVIGHSTASRGGVRPPRWPMGAATYTGAVPAASSVSPGPGTPTRMGSRAVLVPVKAFDQAKRHLHLALNEHERADLSRAMADRVVVASHPLPVAVVCDDNDVAEWARRRGPWSSGGQVGG